MTPPKMNNQELAPVGSGHQAFFAQEGSIVLCRAPGVVPYPEAVAQMERDVAAIRAGTGPEKIWLLEHPALYTAGTSARLQDLRDPHRLPTYDAGRGGQWTYHGPGQRVAYVMLDLRARGMDPKNYVWRLEAWLIAALARLGVQGERREGRIGIWVATSRGESKIAALGIRIRQGVSWHGVSLNVHPDLKHFRGIVPCGLGEEYGVTSLADLGQDCTMEQADEALMAAWPEGFNSA